MDRGARRGVRPYIVLLPLEVIVKSKEDVRRILEANQSCSLDNKEDRERVLAALFDPEPVGVFEEVLGPGFSVICRSGSLIGFTFLNPDDHPTFMSVESLDPGWKEKLLRALK